MKVDLKNPTQQRPYYPVQTVVQANKTPLKDFILRICDL